MSINIASALKDLNEKFGEQTILKMSEAPSEFFEVQVRPSGILQLDHALGAGGIPRGRTIEIYGPESSGKTTIALINGAAFQAADPDCHIGFIDLEQTFDAKYAKTLGIDPKRTIIAQPGTGEEAIDIAYRLLMDGVDYIIIDSVSALVPTAETESSMDSNFIGLQARLMSRALRVLTPAMNKNKAKRANVTFINQIREKAGVMFGNPEITSGGRALSFYASIRMSVRSGAKADLLTRKVEDPFSGKIVTEEYGQKCRISIVKNKIGKPNATCDFDLIYGIGPDKNKEILDMGTLLNVIQNPSAGRYVYISNNKEEFKFHGKDNMISFLNENKEIANEINIKISELVNKKSITVDENYDSL